MTSKRFEIDMGLNASGVARGAKDGEKAIKDLADAVEDASRDGGNDLEQIEDALKDVQRESARTSGDLVDDLRDVERAAERTRDAGKKVGDGMDDGFKRAGEGAEEFRDEAASTAREAAASFDGSAESIGDAFQEIAANAFAGFGPAGAVAGIVAAAGIGLAAAGFEDVGEAQEESEKRASEWAQAFVEAGGKVLTSAQTTAKALSIFTDPELYKQAQQNAENWGVDVSVAVAAMAGEKWALTAANDELTKSEKRIQEEMENTGIQHQDLVDNLTEVSLKASEGRSAYEQLTGEIKAGAQVVDEYSRYLTLMAENTEGATKKVDKFGDTVYTLPDGKQIYIDAETGQATEDVDQIEDKIYGIKDKDVDINAHFNGGGATDGLNRWISQNQGRTVKINGRFEVRGSV